MKDPKHIFLLVLVALVGPMVFGWQGCGCLNRVSLHSSTHLKASDPAPVSVLGALNDGRAFDPDYIHYPDSLTPEQREQFYANYTTTLPQLQAMAAPDAKFYFVYATEFRVPHTHRLILPMEYETAESPSQFEFPSGAEKQTYLVARVRAKGGQTIHIHMLLWKVDGEWRPIVVSSYPAVVRGLTAEQVLTRAEVAIDAGEDLLALTHCFLAHTLARPTPHRVSGLQQKIMALGKATGERLGLDGRPLFSLVVDGVSVAIVNVDGVNFPDGFYVQLHHRIPKLEDGPVIEARQAKIAAAFKELHTEFEKDFIGVAVSELSLDPADGGRGYRTLHPYEE